MILQKKIKFDYLPIKKIEVPFHLKEINISEDIDYSAAINLLYPGKKHFFRTKNKESLTISFIDEFPFGPDLNYLAHFLFDDFMNAVKQVKKALKIKFVKIIGYDFASKNLEDGISFSKSCKNNKNIKLNVYEFYRLFTAIILRKLDNNIILSIFIDYNRLFCFRVPKNTSLSKVYKENYDLAEHVHNFPDSHGYSPLKSVEISSNQPLIEDMNYFILTSSDFIIKNSRNILFPFPTFNRKSKLKKDKKNNFNISPCINCMACSNYCPADLNPSFIYHHLNDDNIDDALFLRLKCCILCGRCSFVCPSIIPLYSKFDHTLKELGDEVEPKDNEVDLHSCGGSCACSNNN